MIHSHLKNLLNLSRGLLLVSCLLVAFGASQSIAFAQTSDNPLPPVFHLMNDRGEEIFLLGTIHIMPAQTPWISDELIDYLDRADVLVLEADINAAQSPEFGAYTMERGTNSDGATLQSQLPPDIYTEFTDLLALEGSNPAMFQSFRPWLVTMLAGVAYSTDHGVIVQTGADPFLQNWTYARGHLQIEYLEELTEQIDLFADLPPEQEVELFSQAIRSAPNVAAFLDVMIEAWLVWDEDVLYEKSFGEAGFETLRWYVMDQRNMAWATRIEGLAVEYDAMFIAVGAGHLVGPNNLMEILGRQGWELQTD